MGLGAWAGQMRNCSRNVVSVMQDENILAISCTTLCLQEIILCVWVCVHTRSHACVCSVTQSDGIDKERNGMDLTEAENIKKRWQEYTEELYKKDLHDPDTHNGVITHLEPDILECEVKWALESITTNKS